MESPGRKYEPAAWLLFLAAAFIARLLALNYESFWHDEIYTLKIIDGPFVQTMRPHGEINQIPPLHFMLLWLWKSVFGSDEFVLRLLSAMCGWGAIVVLGELLRQRVSRRAGWICAVAMLAHVALIANSMFARVYALEIAMGAGLLAVAAAAMDPNCRRPALAACGFGFLGAGLVCAHYFAALFWGMTASVVFGAIFFERQPHAGRRAAVLLGFCVLWGLAATIFLLPLVPEHLQPRGGAGTWIGQVWGEGFQIRGAARAIFELLGARTAEGYSPLPTIALSVAMVLWSAISFAALRRTDGSETRRLGILFTVVSAGQVLVALLAMFVINVLQTRYLITAAVAYCGVIGIAAEHFDCRRTRWVVYAQLVLMCATAVGYFSGHRIIERWDVVAPEVAGELRKGDALIFYPPIQQVNFEYQLPKRQILGTPVEALPLVGLTDYPDGMNQRIPDLLREYRRLFIFAHHEHVWDPQTALRGALSEQRAQIEERELPGRNWKLMIVQPAAQGAGR